MISEPCNVAHVFSRFPHPYQRYLEAQAYHLAKCNDINLRVFSLEKPAVPGMYSIKTYYARPWKSSHWSVNKLLDAVWKSSAVLFHPSIARLGIDLSTIEQAIVRFRPHVIHIQNSFLYSELKRMLQRTRNLRKVIAFRGFDTFIRPYLDKGWACQLTDIFQSFDVLQVMSEAHKRRLVEWGAPPAKCFVIPPAVDTEFFSPPEIQPVSPSDEVRICSAFRLVWQKNIEHNLFIIAALKKCGIRVRYYIAGDGGDLGELYYWRHRLALEKEVQYCGLLSPSELVSLFHRSHVYLQASASEALPCSVLEAQSCGLPVVISDSDGLSEAIVQGRTGFAFQYGDYQQAARYIREIIDGDYERFSCSAAEFIRHRHSCEKEAITLRKIYRECVEHSRTISVSGSPAS